MKKLKATKKNYSSFNPDADMELLKSKVETIFTSTSDNKLYIEVGGKWFVETNEPVSYKQ